MDPAWLVAAISLATVLAGLIALITRQAWKLGRRIWSFIEDWEGKPAEPEHGRPEQPGVLKRLSVVEIGIADISHQVHLNSGQSIRDVVTRTETSVGQLRNSVNTLNDKVERLNGGSS
jgi:hypothetical protein